MECTMWLWIFWRAKNDWREFLVLGRSSCFWCVGTRASLGGRALTVIELRLLKTVCLDEMLQLSMCRSPSCGLSLFSLVRSDFYRFRFLPFSSIPRNLVGRSIKRERWMCRIRDSQSKLSIPCDMQWLISTKNQTCQFISLTGPHNLFPRNSRMSVLPDSPECRSESPQLSDVPLLYLVYSSHPLRNMS